MSETTTEAPKPRTEAEINAEYTSVVAQLGDTQLRAAAFLNTMRQKEEELIKKAQSLSLEIDAVRAKAAEVKLDSAPPALEIVK